MGGSLIKGKKLKVTLNKPDVGLLIPKMIWRELGNFSSGSVCLVIASDVFDEADYIRDLNKFKTESKLKFHSIHVVEISPISPSEELQGFLSADIILEVKYARITGPDGRFL